MQGVNTPIPNAPPDTVTIIDMKSGQARIVAEIPVPNSIVGPTQNVAISPDGAFAIVTSSTRLDPADGTKTVPDDRVTILDLGASPPAVLSTLRAGNGASGVAIDSAGARRSSPIETKAPCRCSPSRARQSSPRKSQVGSPESLLSGVVFSRDGRRALVRATTTA